MRFGAPGQGMVEAGELVVQQRGLEDHFGRFDSPYVELVQYVGSIHEREDIIRRATSKFGPQVGVDVAHHEVDLLLCIWVHGLPFWNHPADECMVVLAGALLLALAGIAVEDLAEDLAGGGIHLDCKRVGELAAVVGEKHREEAGMDVLAEHGAQTAEHLHHRCCAVAVPDEGQHQAAVGEVDGEQALLIDSPPAFHRIHLDDGHVGVLLQEEKVVGTGAADPAGLVLLHVLLAALPPGPVSDLARQVEVANAFEDPCIDVGVDGLRAVAYDLLADSLDDVVDGLSVPQPLAEHRSELHGLVLADDEAGTAFAECALIGCLRLLGPVDVLLQSALRLARTSVAHIGRSLQLHAFLPHIGRAQVRHAERRAVATARLLTGILRACVVEDLAPVLPQAVVVAPSVASLALDHVMAPHFA